MTGRPCSVCSHEDRELADYALAGGAPVRTVATRLALPRTNVQRHARNHLPAALAEAAAAAGHDRTARLLERLEATYDDVDDVADRAVEDEDDRLRLLAVQQRARLLELDARVVGLVRESSTTVQLVTATPAWLEVRTTLLRALQPYPEARQAVAAALVGLEPRPALEVVPS